MSAIIVLGIAVLATIVPGRRRAARIDLLTRKFPSAVVVPVTVGKDQTLIVRRLGQLTYRFHPPQELSAVLTGEQISFWGRRSDEPVAQISDCSITYEVGSYATLAGNFPSLVAHVRRGGAVTDLPLFPLDVASRWIPRQLAADRLEPIATQLNSQQRGQTIA